MGFKCPWCKTDLTEKIEKGQVLSDVRSEGELFIELRARVECPNCHRIVNPVLTSVP